MTQEQKQAVFDYLHKLRASGKINMFLAPGVIAKMFNLDRDTASTLFREWADTFNETEEN